MTISSVGYDGQVNEAEWAELIPRAGSSIYGVSSFADWRPTPGVGPLELKIAAGQGWGHGVLDDSDAVETLALTTTPGTRWDLIVAHRDWDLNLTAFDVIEGTAAKEIPARDITPGDVDDQPVALARVSGGAIAEVIDLRVFAGDGGLFARDELVLQFMDRVGTLIRIGDRLWFRTLNGSGSPIWSRHDVQADTGWIEGTRNGGWVFGFCQFRRIGALIFYRMTATRGVGWNAGNQLAVAPDNFKPDVVHYSGNMHGISGSGGKDFYFDTNGNVAPTHNSAGATGVTLVGSYPAPITA